MKYPEKKNHILDSIERKSDKTYPHSFRKSACFENFQNIHRFSVKKKMVKDNDKSFTMSKLLSFMNKHKESIGMEVNRFK